jgi:hypothetical protein
MNAESVRRLTDVYGTGRNVPLTYVERTGVDDRFLNDITRDKHIVLHGGSKQGKTCLRKYHLKESDFIVVQCTRETTKPKLYEAILKKAGIPSEVSQSKTVTGGAKLKIRLSAEGNLLLIAKAGGAATGETNRDTSHVVESRNFEIDPEDANDVVGALKAAGFTKFIIVKDFHYLAEEVQRSMAVDLKVFHENSNLVFIIVGVWLEADRLTVFNGDLSGRISTINLDDWKQEELLEVAKIGQPLLNIIISDEVCLHAVEQCQGNVGLLQEVLYRICEQAGVWETKGEQKEVGTVEAVDQALRNVADQQEPRYKTFLMQFAEGLGHTELEIYKWLLFAVLTARPAEIRGGLRPNIVFQRIKVEHPKQDSLQQNNISQALEHVGKVQFKHKIQPLILDFSNARLTVVDASFLVFLSTHNREELLELIGIQKWGGGQEYFAGLETT